MQDLHRLRPQCERAYDELARAHCITLSKLALAAEYRDGDTGSHIVRIVALSGLLARKLGKPEAWCNDIEQAAPMHDIGKIGIPDEILKKPGAFTAAVREIMQTHAIIGGQILGDTDVPVLRMAAEIALSHHEQWAGGGYPRRLRGEAIPEAARTVAVIDFIDALTMDRCYRKTISDEVLSMLWSNRGTRFEPRIVDAAIAAFPRLTALRDAVNRVDFGHGMDPALGFLGASH